MISAYDLLARLLGTKPIHVTLGADVFTFMSGNTRSHVRARVWVQRQDGGNERIIAVGDEQPLGDASLIDLASAHLHGMSPDLRVKALTAVLNRGFKGLASEATIQTPEIVFHNDEAIAEAFANHQRDALRQATKGLRTRFA